MDETLIRKLKHDLGNLVQRQKLIIEEIFHEEREMTLPHISKEMDKTLTDTKKTWDDLKNEMNK
ncbi:MAG: hypothetical protein WCG27_08465 [Pseudomonadota bacterium]